MINLEKIRNFFKSLKLWKISDFKKFISELKSKINEFKIKSKNLKKTNYELGIYHFNLGNINDAIFRFKILKKFGYQSEDLEYLLGRCYFEKNKFKKARECFEKCYNKKSKFFEEIDYCLKIINDEVDKIKYVPLRIIEHKKTQQFKYYLSEFNKYINTDENIILEELKKILGDTTKVFNFNLLDLGFSNGLLAYLLRKNQMLNFVLGIDSYSEAIKHCKNLSIGKQKVYNTLINQDPGNFVVSKSKIDAKFDIIIGLNLISYTTEIEAILSSVHSYIENRGIFLLSFYLDANQRKNYYFNNRDEEFIFNKTYVQKVVKKCGWHIEKEDRVDINKQNYSQMTLILKPNHELIKE